MKGLIIHGGWGGGTIPRRETAGKQSTLLCND